MEIINNIESKTTNMNVKDWAKTCLKAVGVLTGIQIGREVGSQTSPFTGFVCGVAVGDMMVRSADSVVDSAYLIKDKFFGTTDGSVCVTKTQSESSEADETVPSEDMTQVSNYGEDITEE